MLRTLKFGRKSEGAADPDFIGFDSKVVSRRHAEIWHVNGEVFLFFTLFLFLVLFLLQFFINLVNYQKQTNKKQTNKRFEIIKKTTN